MTTWTYPMLIAIASAAATVILHQAFKLYRGRDDVKFWMSFPTVGVKSDGLFPWTRAVLRSMTSTASNAADGYQKFCKEQNLPFVIPSLGAGAIVVLPPSQFDLLNKPESQLMAFPAQMETMQPRYMMGDSKLLLFKNAVQFDVVRKHMQKGYGFFASATAEELDDAFSRTFGTNSTDFKTVGVWETCLQVVSRTANRAFIGLPLCRDETLLNQSALYAKMVFQGATLISALPAWSRPILGPVIGLTSKKYAAGCKAILVPYVEQRLRMWSSKEGVGMPNDALQWMIEQSAKGNHANVEPEIIAQRLLILQMVSTYTTAYALSNIIINLYSSKRKDEFVEGLVEECNRVSRGNGGLLTKEAIDSLYRVDSAVRESMRVSPFGVVTPIRIVAPGQTLNFGHGVHLPGGTRIGIPLKGVQHDSRYYPNPSQYDAFRFSRKFEGLADTSLQAKEQELNVSISQSFLTFGYGKHVCPGRWYTSQTLKQALAYIVQHYEVECVGKPKEMGSFLNSILPPEEAQILIRRRTKE
ncbi:hypothetical protein M434DRAFT_374078 [Hypoxylon sp. CO27-5]|nr:hypothetical protein M434DRAFT_374078 [Hypoxylon sp. CO27-5]